MMRRASFYPGRNKEKCRHEFLLCLHASIASKGGTGSVIATDLSVSGGDFIGDTVKEAAFLVNCANASGIRYC